MLSEVSEAVLFAGLQWSAELSCQLLINDLLQVFLCFHSLCLTQIQYPESILSFLMHFLSNSVLCVELLWVPVLLRLFASPLLCNERGTFCSLLLVCACTAQGNESTQNPLCWHACGIWLLLKQDFCWLTPRTTTTSSITRICSQFYITFFNAWFL